MLKKRVILLGCVWLFMMIGCEKEETFNININEEINNDPQFLEDFLSEEYFINNNPYVVLRQSGKFRSENEFIQ